MLGLSSGIFQRLLAGILHDLLIAKFLVYGLSEDAVTFVYSNLKRRKQGVKINDTQSFFQTILSGALQSSSLEPIFFNIFVNDLFLFIKDVKLVIFADDDIIHTEKYYIIELIKLLEKGIN